MKVEDPALVVVAVDDHKDSEIADAERAATAPAVSAGKVHHYCLDNSDYRE